MAKHFIFYPVLYNKTPASGNTRKEPVAPIMKMSKQHELYTI